MKEIQNLINSYFQQLDGNRLGIENMHCIWNGNLIFNLSDFNKVLPKSTHRLQSIDFQQLNDTFIATVGGTVKYEQDVVRTFHQTLIIKDLRIESVNYRFV